MSRSATASGELDRTELPPDIHDDEPRVYFDDVTEWMGLSVTTITGQRIDPEKEENLDGWRDHFDASSEWRAPHYEEQKAYKSARGTLGHYAILSQLGDVERGEEEDDAEALLKEWDQRRPAIVEDDIQYYGDPHAYDGEQAWSRCMRDINWAIEEFHDVAEEYDITPENTIAVEEYVRNDDPAYAGQYDLLYERDSDTVLADLKLSSAIRHDYRLQLCAYATAIEDDVDVLMTIRLHPDNEEVEVQTDDEWDRSRDGLTHEFLGLADRVNTETLDQLTFDDIRSIASDP